MADFRRRVDRLRVLMPIPRLFRDRLNPLEFLAPSEVRDRYRFYPETIMFLVNSLYNELDHQTFRSSPLPPLLTMLVTLQFYASGAHYIVIGDRHGIAKSSVCRAVRHGTSAICTLMRQTIRFPTSQEELTEVKRDFYNVAHFPKVVGAIDCTHIPIKAPSVNEPDFVNRKGFHSLNVQVVCDAKFRIINIVAKWPGSVHDSRIFRESALGAKCENRELDGLLLGDSGYPCRQYLMTPYLNVRTPAQRRYNESQTKTRVLVEQTFGIVKRRFPCLSYGLRTKADFAAEIAVACAILHNIGLSRGDIFSRWTDIRIEAPEVAMPVEPNNGGQYRDVFAETYFN